MPKVDEAAMLKQAKKGSLNNRAVVVVPGGWPNSAQVCLFLAPIGSMATIEIGQCWKFR
jgi:hypothetical protein